MLFEHLKHLRSDDILLLDRGYPSRWLLAHLTQKKIAFCMRVDDCGFTAVRAFLRSGQQQAIVCIDPPDRADCVDFLCERTPTTVRLVRVVTPNGRVYAVMTSLLDPLSYPAAAFADLYHRRWRIEEAFKRLKQRLALENPSGLSWLAAQQNFGAKILADHLHALAATAATEQQAVPENYKVNRTSAFAHLKRCLPRWLLVASPSIDTLMKVFAELAKNLVQFRPGVSKPRPIGPEHGDLPASRARPRRDRLWYRHGALRRSKCHRRRPGPCDAHRCANQPGCRLCRWWKTRSAFRSGMEVVMTSRPAALRLE